MSLWIALLIMLASGVFGGLVNYITPSNEKEEGTGAGKRTVRIRSRMDCILLGLAATLLVPIFLELAQSKLLDNIHTRWSLLYCPADSAAKQQAPKLANNNDTLLLHQNIKIPLRVVDSMAAIKANALVKKEPACSMPVKSYLLWLAYCLLAATAGLRFINGVLNSVLKDKELATAKDNAAKAAEAKEKAERESRKRKKQNELNARMAERKALTAAPDQKGFTTKSTVRGLEALDKNIEEPDVFEYELPPVTVTDDPQKGRFGGESESNGRALSAFVNEEPVGMFYDFKLVVRTSDNKKPLRDVIFYLHDSFSPAVIRVAPNEAGEAVLESSAYGAFTVGVVTDGGETLLELDMADPKYNFPADFRSR
jgi:hypothetical protein